MDSTASRVGSEGVVCPILASYPPSKLKTYGFAIAIIVGISGLAVGVAGLTGYFHVGALSNMAQIDAIIMMAAGGGGGTVLLIIGITGAVKTRQNGKRHQNNDGHENPVHGSRTHQSDAIEPAEATRSIHTQDGLVYGPEAWKIWNVEVLDTVLPAPRVDLSNGEKILLYIPKSIQFQGKKRDLTLKTLQEIHGEQLQEMDCNTEKQFGNKTAPGWVLIDKNMMPESLDKDYETQKNMVEERGCSMPSILEAAVLYLVVFSFTGERLDDPLTFTYCAEKLTWTEMIDSSKGAKEVEKQANMVVGGYNSLNGLHICREFPFHSHHYGTRCVQRQFNPISN